MNQKFYYSRLIIEYLLRSLLAIWLHAATVSWERHWKTISITFHLKPEQPMSKQLDLNDVLRSLGEEPL